MAASTQACHEAPSPIMSRGHKRPVHCQARNCSIDLSLLGRQYFIRKKICSEHLTAETVLLDSAQHGEEPFRFCQQCGKLEPLTEFEGAKRSCRQTLQRRRESKQHSHRPRKRYSSDTVSETSEVDDHTPQPRSRKSRIPDSATGVAGSWPNAHASGPLNGESLQSLQINSQAIPWCNLGQFGFSPEAAAAAVYGPSAPAVPLPMQQQQQTSSKPPACIGAGAECGGMFSSLTAGVAADCNTIQFNSAGVGLADIPLGWCDVPESAQAHQIEAHQQANIINDLTPPDQSDTGDLLWDAMLQAVCQSFPAPDDVINGLLAPEVAAATVNGQQSEQQQQQAAAVAAVVPQGGSYPAAAGHKSLSPGSVNSSRAPAAEPVLSDPHWQHLLHIVHQQQQQLNQQQLQLQQLLPPQSDPKGPATTAGGVLASPTAVAAAAGGQIAMASAFASPQDVVSAWDTVSAAGAASTQQQQQQQLMLPTSSSAPTLAINTSATSAAALGCLPTPATGAAGHTPAQLGAISNLVQLESALSFLSSQLGQFQTGVRQSVVQLVGTGAQAPQQQQQLQQMYAPPGMQ